MTSSPAPPQRLPGASPRSSLATLADLPEARWAALSLGLFGLGGIGQVCGAPAVVWWVLYLACYLAGGWEPALSGLRALRDKALDVDMLMIVAAIAAASVAQVLDGALLIVIFSTSGALEAFVTRRTADSIGALLTLAPERATRIRPPSSGRPADRTTEEVDIAELLVGDLTLVRPGERIGADGIVVEGASEVDQASITGEPLPATKQIGSRVFAGTVNGTGVLVCRVSTPAHDSVVARIVSQVEKASQTKAKAQLFIDKVEQRYSLAVVAATLTIFVAPLALGAHFQPTLLRAMTFMIVASPCAVVLATMPPLLAAIANAGRNGVLIKSAVAMENLRGLDVIAFDKTGTLTRGLPAVSDVVALGDLTPPEVLAIAAAAEQSSEHPIGRAIVDAAAGRGLPVSVAERFRATPGRGVDAYVGGHAVHVGTPTLLGGEGDAEATEQLEALEASGRTAVLVAIDRRPVGVIALSDRVRDEAPRTVARLISDGTRAVILTGDNDGAARLVGDRVGITARPDAVGGDIRSGLLPAGKAEIVAAFQEAGHHVMLVGDGINDAPAMATADVAVAMGRGGSDLAVETADAILVHDDISALPTVIGLARRAHRVVTANLVFASCVIAALVLWDFAGDLPLPLGVAGHEGSTIVVGLNGLRLLSRRTWRNAAT